MNLFELYNLEILYRAGLYANISHSNSFALRACGNSVVLLNSIQSTCYVPLDEAIYKHNAHTGGCLAKTLDEGGCTGSWSGPI